MSEEIIEEEKDTLEDSTENPSEETVPEDHEDDLPADDHEEDEFEDLSEEELREKARKWKKTASSYKTEIDTKGLRKKERKVATTKSQGTDTQKNDYLSKRQDVLDDFKDEFSGLPEEDWNKIQGLIEPALDNIYNKASSEDRFVARGELKRTIGDLVNFAKGPAAQRKSLEKARQKGAIERQKLEDAEIGGRSARRSKSGQSKEVQELAKKKGWTPSETKDILDARAARKKEYAPKHGSRK